MEGSPWVDRESSDGVEVILSSRVPAQLPGCTPVVAEHQRRKAQCGTQEIASQATCQNAEIQLPTSLAI